MLSLLWDKTTVGIRGFRLEDLNMKLEKLFVLYLTAEKNQTRLQNTKMKMSKMFLQTMGPYQHADVEKNENRGKILHKILKEWVWEKSYK